MNALSPLDCALLNQVQKGFPLEERPFAVIAQHLGMSENAVLERLQQLDAEGVISRFGAVFEPNTVGASTLAALTVPPEHIRETAELVNAMPGVNHNYLREHEFNLWFVITGRNREELTGSLADIERKTGYPMLDLPMEQAYHIDLGFPL